MAVTKDMIDSAKQVAMGVILDEFDWHTDKYNRILCPSIEHDDKNPGVYVKPGVSSCKCFACNKSFDTINLYMALMEKARGKKVSFPQAVEDILELDGQIIDKNWQRKMEPVSYQKSSNANLDYYDKCLSKSYKISGYEFEYLKRRGIFIYDSIVYKKKVYDVKQLKKDMQTNPELEEIYRCGKLYYGIGNILRQNGIEIRHLWDAEHRNNHIIYKVEYDYYTFETEFLEDTERRMLIRKAISGGKFKAALGNIDFCFVTAGFDEECTSSDIYICEGIEDALSFAQEGYKSISLNSTSNLQSFMEYFSGITGLGGRYKFVIAFDNDEAGRKATQQLVEWIEKYNQTDKEIRGRYHRPLTYSLYDLPPQFNDVNEYWVSRVYE